MSQQAGQSTSTEGDQAKQQQQQQQQVPTPSQLAGLDLNTQQQLLQQFAARLPGGASNNLSGSPGGLSFLGGLPNLTLPPNRKTSGNNTTGAANGSAPPANTLAGALPSAGGNDVSSLQARLQARMFQDQQQAQQAAALRAATNANPGQQQTLPTPRAEGPKPPNGIPEWAAAAAASGVLGNINGSDREAIMKQLQALHTSHVQRSKAAPGLAGPSTPSNPAATAPSPANATAPSPAGGSVSAPSPAPNATTPQADPVSAPSPMNAIFAAAGRQNNAGSPAAPSPGAGPGGMPGRPPVRPAMIQKQQLLQSLVSFFKSTNQPLPQEIFNGERDGAFKLGDVWIELTEMFIAVFRLGGMIKLTQTQDPKAHPVWLALLNNKGIPATLPSPVAMPRMPGTDVNTPPQMTTSAVDYLIAGYKAWIFGFEQAMQRSKLAHLQKQQQAAAMAAAGVRPPQAGTPSTPTAPGPPVGIPTPMTAPSPLAPSPAMTAPTPPVMTAPSPVATAMSPAFAAPSPAVAPSPIVAAPSPAVAAPSPAAAKPPTLAKAPTPVPEAQPRPQKPEAGVGSPSIANGNANPALAQKRKRDLQNESKASPAGSSSPASATASAPPESAKPKRARYKVEYRPLHFPQPAMAGWDERSVMAAMPKHRVANQVRNYHELQVDVEAILMGLRSRLPREVGYALTVLSMLSMPHHDQTSNLLPISHLQEVYRELLELIGESALGEAGLDGWLKQQAEEATESGRASAPPPHDLARLSYAELEQLGLDLDFSVDDEAENFGTGSRERTGGKTDIVLAGLNIIRNFSLLMENQVAMARPELFNLLAAITDVSLVRMPGELTSDKPYSILELARVRREAVSVLTNLGNSFDLRNVPKFSVLGIVRLLSGFICSGWEYARRSPAYGPSASISIRELPPRKCLSLDRALEAFSRLSLMDHNREVLAVAVPSEELVDLFAALIKQFPLSNREVEAMHTVEDFLGRAELVALSVYSLAFLAPLQARAGMRATPGATAVLARVVYSLTPRNPDLKGSPFGILVRRVAETLGVLNGTVNPGGNAERMSFAAGGIDGKGWRFASDVVEPGWLAHDAERVLESMGWGRGDDGRIWRVDKETFSELDGLWC